MKRIEDLINSKNDIEIPAALDKIVSSTMQPKSQLINFKKVIGGAAAVVIALNAFPAVATSVRDY
ncbi:MAG: hypothetical protein RL038_1219, partial [Actinomycetota bacterium]